MKKPPATDETEAQDQEQDAGPIVNEPVVLDDENGNRLLVSEMNEEQLRAHCEQIETLLRKLLRMGQRVYSEYRGQPTGIAYLEAVKIVGDEAIRLRLESHGIRHSGRIDTPADEEKRENAAGTK